MSVLQHNQARVELERLQRKYPEQAARLSGAKHGAAGEEAEESSEEEVRQSIDAGECSLAEKLVIAEDTCNCALAMLEIPTPGMRSQFKPRRSHRLRCRTRA